MSLKVKTKILRERDLDELTGLSRTTRWRLEQVGKFPKRLRLSNGSIGWRESDINSWVDQLQQVGVHHD